ncbi:hypothetical protein TWF706_002057 [Orbilia oligospora]|uniref:Uncharacterized protein n=1 Tax=Orbilia oligospora TaxID=2813651 RepID=A0A7C8NSC5_ORBOL|nr:hypothetical protein TWF706_002057 [Orbilia oligospora]KAF3133371.1 hypothetical protein TWF703_006910 [Orbilia oligospora]
MPAVHLSISPSLSYLMSISTKTSTATVTTTLTITSSLSPSSLVLPSLSRSIPGINPSSPYLTSNAMTNETMLTNAIFSHPAIITWASLFSAFLIFAGMVFGLQKIMRRIRARKWIKGQLLRGGRTTITAGPARAAARAAAGSDTTTTSTDPPNINDGDDTKPCCGKETTNESADKEKLKHKKNRNRKAGLVDGARVYSSKGCEFINGSDLSLRADEGVDERSGSWSKRRDKRFEHVKPGGNGRKVKVVAGRLD